MNQQLMQRTRPPAEITTECDRGECDVRGNGQDEEETVCHGRREGEKERREGRARKRSEDKRECENSPSRFRQDDDETLCGDFRYFLTLLSFTHESL